MGWQEQNKVGFLLNFWTLAERGLARAGELARPTDARSLERLLRRGFAMLLRA
jgi:hypothetical protein